MAELFGSNNPLTAQLVALALPKSDSKKPNKSTAVAARTRTNYNPAITGNDLIKANARRNKKDSFTIDYYVGEVNGKEVKSRFTFALLPAIDNIVNYSASGPFRGNESVPEVKPGIPVRTAMKHRNTVIPGGTNVVQTIGIDSKYIVLVGAFVGTEKSTSGASVSSTFYDTVYQRIGSNSKDLPEYNSYKQAMLFNKEVVEKGAPVNIIVQTEGQKADESIKVTGVIVDFKIQAVREAKTYYAMTVLYTDQAKTSKTKSKSSAATAPTPASKESPSNIPKAESKTEKSTTNSSDSLTAEQLKQIVGLKEKVWDDATDKYLKDNYGLFRIQEGGGFDFERNDDSTYTIRRYKTSSSFVEFKVEKKLLGGWFIKEVNIFQ